ncbi:peptidoglycan endopeptidase [Lactobacillus sp. XV13L]|nr:peptidoglycan endopeptidase [Lactobacillus sp. XV13L]
MKYQKQVLASIVAIALMATMGSSAAVAATTNQVPSTEMEVLPNEQSKTSKTSNDVNRQVQLSEVTLPAQSTKTKTIFKGLYTKYKWTAGDQILDRVALNSAEKRPVFLQKWNGKKYIIMKKYVTDDKGNFTVTYPAVWYHHLHSTWRLYVPSTSTALAATSDKIAIKTVRRYQIPQMFRQPHMTSLHIKGYYASPLDQTLNYASTRSDYIRAFLKRGFQYKNARTAWVDFTTKEPGTSVDCSGLVMQCMYATGIDPSPANPRWHATHEWGCRSFVQSPTLQTVSLKKLRQGDLIFYGRPKKACYHVGIYLGHNKVLHSWPAAGVSVWPANFRKYYYAKRVFPLTKAVGIHEMS